MKHGGHLAGVKGVSGHTIDVSNEAWRPSCWCHGCIRSHHWCQQWGTAAILLVSWVYQVTPLILAMKHSGHLVSVMGVSGHTIDVSYEARRPSCWCQGCIRSHHWCQQWSTAAILLVSRVYQVTPLMSAMKHGGHLAGVKGVSGHTIDVSNEARRPSCWCKSWVYQVTPLILAMKHGGHLAGVKGVSGHTIDVSNEARQPSC